MTALTGQMSGYQKTVRPRTVAVISCHPDQHVTEAVLGAVDHDVVLVEPTAHAYSHIKHVRPDLVIIVMTGDDIEGCQLLSMLTLDRETSRIPVITHVIPAEDNDADMDLANVADESVRQLPTLALN